MCFPISLLLSLSYYVLCVCECVFWLWKLLRLARGRPNCAQLPCLVAHRFLVRVCPRGCHRHRSDLRRVKNSENWKYSTRWWHTQTNIILVFLLFFQFDFMTFSSAQYMSMSIVDLLAGENCISIFPPIDSHTTLINSSNILLRFVSLTFRFGHGYGTE